MTQEEYNLNRKKGSITDLPAPESETQPEKEPLTFDFETYLIILNALQRPKRHLTAAPTFVPRNFAEQIQFSDNGTTRKVHFYINNAWREITVT